MWSHACYFAELSFTEQVWIILLEKGLLGLLLWIGGVIVSHHLEKARENRAATAAFQKARLEAINSVFSALITLNARMRDLVESARIASANAEASDFGYETYARDVDGLISHARVQLRASVALMDQSAAWVGLSHGQVIAKTLDKYAEVVDAVEGRHLDRAETVLSGIDTTRYYLTGPLIGGPT